MRLLNKTVLYSRMIKIEHTIFALPFALAAVVLAYPYTTITLPMLGWIILAMTGARSAAMGFNRIVDAHIDAKNPRTAIREIPQGLISRTQAAAFVVLSSLLFVVSAAMLSTLCLILSFPVLLLLFFYSYAKRFTWLAHVILGLAIGLAPMGVWIALTGAASWRIGVLCAALLSYIAGFDILYSCQDASFDRKEGLYSIPARFGIRRALWIARLLHVISFCALAALYQVFSLSPVYLALVVIIGVLFIMEHKLVHPEDLSRVNIAFFNVNSVISVLVLAAVLAGQLLAGVL